jgi:hypothetical protein
VWFGEDLVMLLLVQIVNFVQTVEKFGRNTRPVYRVALILKFYYHGIATRM